MGRGAAGDVGGAVAGGAGRFVMRFLDGDCPRDGHHHDGGGNNRLALRHLERAIGRDHVRAGRGLPSDHLAPRGVKPAAGGWSRGSARRGSLVRPLTAALGQECDRRLRPRRETSQGWTHSGRAACEGAPHLHGGLLDGGYVVRVRLLARHRLGSSGAARGVDVRPHVRVAQRDDELRNLGGWIDRHLDAIDARGALGSALRILQLELFPDLEKAELTAHGDLGGVGVLDLGSHRRRETVDVQAHLGPGLGRREPRTRAVRGAAFQSADTLERADTFGVHVGETDGEFAAVLRPLRPGDFTRREDALPCIPVEAARYGLTRFRQVRRAKQHPFLGDVHGPRLERRPHRPAHFDQRLERHPRRSGRPAILAAHLFLRHPGR